MGIAQAPWREVRSTADDAASIDSVLGSPRACAAIVFGITSRIGQTASRNALELGHDARSTWRFGAVTRAR
jgi:hypothetical protein